MRCLAALAAAAAAAAAAPVSALLPGRQLGEAGMEILGEAVTRQLAEPGAFAALAVNAVEEMDWETGVAHVSARRALGEHNLVNLNKLLGTVEVDLSVAALTEGEKPYLEVFNAQCVGIPPVIEGCVTLYFWFQDPDRPEPLATCADFQIGDIEFDVNLTRFKEFWPPDATPEEIEYDDGMFRQVVDFNVTVVDVSFRCVLPTRATDSVSDGGDPMTHDYLQKEAGTLTFTANAMDARLGALAYSALENLTYSVPSEYVLPEINYPGNRCAESNDLVDLKNTTYLASELKGVTIAGIPIPGINLTESVTEQLNGESRDVAEEPLKEVLCGLIRDGNVLVADLLVNNTFANMSDPTYLLLPEDHISEEDLMSVETRVQAAVADSASVKLVNLGDNWLVNLVGIFPEESRYLFGEDVSEGTFADTIYSFLGAEPSPDDGFDPILYVVDYFLNTSFAETGAVLVDYPVLELAESLLGKETVDASKGIDIDLAFQVVDGQDAFIINATVATALFSLDPKRPSTDPAARDFLESIQLSGNQTLKIPPIDVGDLSLRVDLSLDVNFLGGESLIDPNAPEDDTAAAIFRTLEPLKLSDTFSVTLTWDAFYAELGVALMLDENAIRTLNLGPLVDAPVDCLVSTFVETPRVSGFVLNAGGIGVAFEGVDEGIYGLIGDAIETLFIPAYQGVLPGLLEEAAKDLLVDEELLEPTTCSKATVPSDPLELLSLDGALTDLADEYLTESLVGTLLDTFFPKEEDSKFNSIIAEPIELVRFNDLPAGGGLNVTLELIISKIEVAGINPPNFTIFRLLEVDPSQDEYPHQLFNELEVGIPSNPIILGVELELNTLPDREFSRRLDADALVSHSAAAPEEPLYRYQDWRTLQAITYEPTVSPSMSPSVPPTTPRPSLAPSTAPPSAQPEGLQLNTVRLEIEVTGVYALADLIIKVLRYTVESTELQDVLEINCWLGMLQKPSRPKDIKLAFGPASLRVDCIPCNNAVLTELSRRFAENPTASKEFFELINEVIDIFADGIERLFNDESFDETVGNFERQCQGLDPLNATDVEYDAFPQDLTGAYAFAGGTMLVMLTAAGIACCCVKGTHTPAKHKYHFEDEKKVHDILQLEDTEDMRHVAEELERETLFNHRSVPLFCRFFVPVMLTVNLALFVIGNVGVALVTSVAAEIAGIPIGLDNFATVSVISSAISVLEAGGYLLAFLLIGMSIVWPYFKLLGMAIAWFAPVKLLSFHKRGELVKRLDQLGKVSLVELYFIVFVFVAFKLDVASPRNEFLPASFYRVALILEPQLSLYTFTTALLTSLFLSNVIEYYHEKVEKQVAYLCRDTKEADKSAIGLYEYHLPSRSAPDRRVVISKCGVAVLCVLIVSAIGAFGVAATLPAIDTEINGLAALIIKLENKPVVTEYSLFSLSSRILGSPQIGQVYLGLAFIGTILVIPILQLLCTLYMLVGRFTLKSAALVFEVNQVLCAWSCAEIYLIALVLTVLEVKKVSSYLLRDSCDFVQPIMEQFLRPRDLVDGEDVEATCFGITSQLLLGAPVLLVAVIVANIVHYVVLLTFVRYMSDRLNLKPDSKSRAGLVFERIALALRFATLSGSSAEIEV